MASTYSIPRSSTTIRGQPGDVAGFKAGLAEVRAAFPDLRLDVEKLVEEGDTVSGLFWMSGTHLGPFMGAPATGRTFRVRASDVVRMREGRIVEHWGLIDGESLARQLCLAGAA